jgi:CHAT domain-containing protein
LKSLGIAWTRLGDPERAKKCYTECLGLAASETLDPLSARRTIQKAGANLAMLDLDRGDYAAARARFEAAAELARSNGEPLDEASALVNLAIVCGMQGEREAASRHALAGLSLLDGRDPRLQAGALRTLADCEFGDGQLDRALEYAYQAIAIDESSAAGLDDASSRDLGLRQESSFELAQKILVAQGKYGEALTVLERGRARAFRTTFERRHGSTAKARAIKAEFLNLAFHALRMQDPVDLPPGAVASILSATSKSPVEDVSLEPFDIARIHNLGATLHATFLVYSLMGDRVFVWVLKEGAVSFKETKLTQPRELHQLAGEFQKDRSSMDVDAVTRRTYDLLIAPVDELLPKQDGARLGIVPSGPMLMLPFPCFESASGPSLGERFALFTAPSLEALHMIFSRKSPASSPDWSRALVVGNPVMPPARELGSRQLPALPYARAEAEAIAGLLKAEPLIGEAATAEAVLARISSAPVVHLATHALLNDVNDDSTAIALAASDKHSGLVAARELSSLDLTSLEMVSLSACSTGRGTVTGDGVAGLSRAFHVAGARRVLASLRPVPDRSTSFLMQAFYRELRPQEPGQDLDAPRALREAIRTTRKTYPHPVDWAGFVLSGTP